MTEYTRPATWDDVKTVIRYLEDEGVEYALVGGYALGVHGFNRFTEDIDILVNPAAENSRRWILALSRLPDEAASELVRRILGRKIVRWVAAALAATSRSDAGCSARGRAAVSSST